MFPIRFDIKRATRDMTSRVTISQLSIESLLLRQELLRRLGLTFTFRNQEIDSTSFDNGHS